MKDLINELCINIDMFIDIICLFNNISLEISGKNSSN